MRQFDGYMANLWHWGRLAWALRPRGWPGPPPRARTPELLDGGGHDPALLAENLADMGRANRWLGGAWLVSRLVARLAGGLPPGTPLVVLDVASGGADIPRALARRFARRSRPALVVASDASPAVARIGAARGAVAQRGARRKAGTEQAPPPPYIVADARALPVADGGVDVAVCSFALHHFDEAEAVGVLRELRRVARRGVVLDDLVRSRAGYAGAWLFARLTSRNPLTRHDGPLSARRAYTRAELLALLQEAGYERLIWRDLGYRVVLASEVR